MPFRTRAVPISTTFATRPSTTTKGDIAFPCKARTTFRRSATSLPRACPVIRCPSVELVQNGRKVGHLIFLPQLVSATRGHVRQDGGNSKLV
jgi:hypothetical protein